MNLMNFLNQCYRSASSWKFQLIQESKWEWIDLVCSYQNNVWSLNHSQNWNKWDLTNVLWASDLVSSPSEKELTQWIMNEHLPQRVKGIAPDTNLIIPGFITNYLKRLLANPHELIPVLVLFARSIQFELHTMRPFTYSRRDISEGDNFLTEIFEDFPLLMKLWNIPIQKGVSGILGLQNYRGRIGLKGTFEVDLLHQWAPVIIVKPAHILHSSKIIDQTPFLNAVHDSLIRYEIDFIAQNTSLPILFVTNDKDQCKSAEQEGSEALYIQRPYINYNRFDSLARNLSMEKLRMLIINLLELSPVVRFLSSQEEYLITWTWRGRRMDDVADHKIKTVDSKGKVAYIFP